MAIKRDGEESTFVNKVPTLIDFETKFRRKPTQRRSLASAVKNVIKNSVNNFDAKKTLLGTFTFVEALYTYDFKEYFFNDLIAGIMAGVTSIPQSMAYASLSTLPQYVGLYMSFFAPLTYFFFGTSQHLAWGCIAIVSIMFADIMNKYDTSAEAREFIANWSFTQFHNHSFATDQNASSYYSHNNNLYEKIALNSNLHNSSQSDNLLEAIAHRRIEVACGVTVMSGLVCIVASIIGFHRISTVMSNSLITGFTVGISFHVATSQVKHILGLSIERYSGTGRIFRTWAAIFSNISDTKVIILVISLVCILAIYLVKKCINERYKMKIPIPIELAVVIGGILLSYQMEYIKNHEVKVVGKVPWGIPAPKFPDLSLSVGFIGDGLVIMFVSYAQSLAMAKTMGIENDYVVDPQQEMLASGLCTTVCGFFSGFIPGGTMSITLVQSSSGGRTRVASLFSATVVLLVILILGRYVKYLPICVMAAIILINLRSMFSKLLRLPVEWRSSRYDCIVWIFACVVTIVLDTGLALLVGVAFSLLLVIFGSMMKPVYEIGQIQNDTMSSIELRSFDNYDCVQKLASVKLIKIKTPVIFLNSDILVTSLKAQINIDPVRIKSVRNSTNENSNRNRTSKYGTIDEYGMDSNMDIDSNENDPVSALVVKAIILDISEVSLVDAMGVNAFDTVIQEFNSVKVDVLIASVPENLFDILQSTGFWVKHKERLYLNVQAALASLPASLHTNNVNESDFVKSTESVH